MKRLIAILVSCSVTLLATAHAGVVMNLVSKNSAGTVTSQIVISADGDKVRMDQQGDSTSIIFLGAGMLILDHSEQVYIVMDDAMIDQLTGAIREMEAQLAAMPPEQRAMVQQMMQGGMMPGAEKPPTPRLESLGSGSWGDYSCRQYAMYEADAKVGEFCAAAFGDIKGGEEVMTAVMGMMDYMQKIIDAMPSNMASMIGDNPFDFISDIDGFPVRSLTYEAGKLIEETTLESVTEADLAADLFVAPANYRKQDTGM